MILAAIDIGSNAVRLLITEVQPEGNNTPVFTKLNLVRIPLRLGLEVFTSGQIPDDKVEKLLDTLRCFQLLCKVYDVEHYTACATSAMRDAGNGTAIVEAIKADTGLDVRIISGAEEAGILYENHIANLLDAGRSYLYIDVGGGSTEITLFAGDRIRYKASFNIGTIRLLEDQITDAQWQDLKATVKRQTRGLKGLAAIGSGGNINKVFSLSKTKEGKPLSLDSLKDCYKELNGRSVDERMQHYGLRRDRADVIVPALRLYTSIMRWSGADLIYVPKVGLADGLIKMLYRAIDEHKNPVRVAE